MKEVPFPFSLAIGCAFLFYLVSANLLVGQELVVNGSFENTSGTFVPDANGEMSLPTNSTVIPGWTVVSGELIWANNTNVFGPQTPDGSFFLDLTGYHDAAPYGGVTQTLPTIPGMNYRVSISLGQYERNSIYNGPVSARVAAGSVSNLFTLGTSTTNANQWQDFELDFTASSNATTIQIVGNTTHGGHYIGLDNASLKLQSGGPEILTNGGFENTSSTFVPDGNQVMSLGVGSTSIPGWTIASGETVWATNANAFGPFTPYGGMFLDLTGYHDGSPYGGVSQTVPTKAGQNYRLTFSVGADAANFNFSGPVSVIASADSNSGQFTAEAITNVWGTFTFDFVAASSATPLRIIGTATAGGQYIGLDNVSVQPHVVPFLITSFNRINASDLRLGFNSQTGKIYAVQSRADLTSGNWITVPGTTNTGNGSTLFVTLTNGVSGPRQFYRVEQFQ